ncbi:MAG: DMT family transporter [Chloroflexota bacterium]
MTNQFRYSLYALLSAVIAGIVWVLTEIAINFFHTPSLIATMWGALIGSLVLLAVAMQRGGIDWRSWTPSAWARAIVGGFLIHGAGFLLSFAAAGQIGAGKANLLGQLQTFFVVALAILFLNETLSRRRLVAILLALFGATLINFDPSTLWVTWGLGETLTIGGRLMIAVGIVLMKPLFDHGNAAGTTGLAMLIGAFFLFGAFPFSRTMITIDPGYSVGWATIMMIGLIGIGRGLSWLCFNTAQRYIGASQAIIIFLSYAFFTILFQAIVVWIAPNVGVQLPKNLGIALVGGVLIAAGIIILQTD